MDIERLGYQTAGLLLERGLVRDPGDLYDLTARDLGTLPGFQRRSIEKLLAAIESSKQRPLWRLLVALSIPHVGPHHAQLLATAFGSLGALARAPLTALRSVEGIGPEIAESLAGWFAAPANRRLIEKLERNGVRPGEERNAASAEGPLAGKTVVITGTLASMSRQQATVAAQAAGARVASSVSARTDLLVVGAEPGTKLARARALSVTTADEAEFLRLLGQH